MKKPTLNLLAAAAVAALLVSAHAAQPPDQNNNGAPPPGAPMTPPGGDQPPMPGGNAPDAGGPQGMPTDTNAVPGQEQPMPTDAAQGNNGTTPGDNNNMAPGDNNSASGNNADNNTDNNTPGGSTVITPGRNRISSQDVTSEFVPPAELGTNADQLKLNFRNAPLEMVLNYLSDAAGFIIDLQTHVNGNVSVISAHPMTRDEAVDLLNAVLNRNGYAAIRHGRRLTIVDKNDAKTQNIPVISGNDPTAIPDNAEIITQIIPIRFVDARQLVSDLTSFVSPQATVVANDAGNSIVITDTQQNIRHLTEIIRAIDDSAEAETEIKVFPLKFASPVDVANELGSVFPSSTGGSGGTQAPIRFGGGGFGGGGFGRLFGGGGGGFGGGGGGGGAGGGSGTSDRIRKETQVTAVADSRIQAVIVTAPKDLMDEIASMMKSLDVPSERDQKVYVFNMKNGDPQAALTVLQGMFQTSSSRGGGTSGTSSSQNTDALQTRIQNNIQSSSSTSSSGFGSSFGGGGGGRTGGQY